MKLDESELARIFAELGANDPEGWAHSQVADGIPQLHRYLFLRQLWQCVASEADDSWIDAEVADHHRRVGRPLTGGGRAIERMLKLGVARSDIVDLVRSAQVKAMFDFCYRLGDPCFTKEEEELFGWVGWLLVKADADEEPTDEIIGGLHASVLDTDPTGREMCPRPDTA